MRGAILAAAVASCSALTITPKPSSVTATGQLMGVDSVSFDFAATGANSPYLRDAFTRYYGIIFSDSVNSEMDSPAKSAAWQVVKGCDVNVKGKNTSLTIETDASYTLTIKAPRATIEANTVYGAMYGLESLSQLIYRGMTVNETTVTDKPRYQFRAVMVRRPTICYESLDYVPVL